MAVYFWTTLTNGQVISDFDSEVDVLRFNDVTIAAASVVVQAASASSVRFTYLGKSVTLGMSIWEIAERNLEMADGSRLLVGDNDTDTTFDNLGGELIGGPGNDQLIGGNGGGGDNGYLLFGMAGNDLLTSGNGEDELDGGAGTDVMRGGRGDDIYMADVSADRVVEAVGAGTDEVWSTATYTLSANLEVLLLLGDGTINGSGNVLDNEILGNGAPNSLWGRGGNDFLSGAGGPDTLNGGVGADVMEGGEGFDWVYYAGATVPVKVNLGSGPDPSSNDAAGDEWNEDIEGILGTRFGDDLHGNDFNNTFDGDAGADAIYGWDGNDLLLGGAGSDTITGGNGTDRLFGNLGNDEFRFHIEGANGDRVDDFSGNGASAGDRILFIGFGTPADGTVFVQTDATHWQVRSADGTMLATLEFANAAAIHATDYQFI